MADTPPRSSHIIGKLAAAFTAIILLLATLVGVSASASASVSGAHAAIVAPKETATASLSGSSFQRGYIISDYLFYQQDAMTQAQVQSFLDAECPTHNCIDTVTTTTADRAASNMCPTAYTGAASETTAAIIYKVEQSCGISAKVILVTLQKEEGLVTMQNPSAAVLRKAMGYGCPDTSVCNSLYYGLFNQIYDAASQFKRYGLRTADNVSFRTRYQIGVTTAIAKSPTASCGAINVVVQDMATTALYYYTPYTPDAAALANLGGVGDSCSAYGNRNFWVYWNNWFGSPIEGEGDDKINAAYVEDGGSTGALGAAVGNSTCTVSSTACSQTYANGAIYWSSKTGAVAVDGSMYAPYVASGAATGPLGYPTANYVAVTNATNGNGGDQQFVGGVLYTSTAGTFAVSAAIEAEYVRQSTYAGKLGWPTAARSCTGVYCSQAFQGGIIESWSSTAAESMLGSYATEWTTSGGMTGTLGHPTGEQVTVVNAAHGNGGGQQFVGGTIYSSAAGYFSVVAAMKLEYSREGSNPGKLGWPTADRVCVGSVCTQTYQGGTIVSWSSTAAESLLGTYATAYATAGGTTGPLGHPTGEQVVVVNKAHGNGGGQQFVGGTIYSSAAGYFAVVGKIKTAYAKAGSNAGKLGWPTDNQVCTGSVCTQHFQGGTLTE